MNIVITRFTSSDEQFFLKLYSEHAQQNLPFLPHEQLDKIVEMQYLAQLSYYNNQWPDAITYLVQAEHLEIGKIILSKYQSGLHIIDVVIGEKYRNKGFGRKLLTLVEQRALDIGCTKLTLSVATNNRAKKLYDYLGYKVTSQNETHTAMQKQLVKS
ncbi:GNAT family N-acetyltransferase [Colwellia psychrerythraea]|nr:GNAT family N-acetyltransferase [Colwellia psychrerythraea]